MSPSETKDHELGWAPRVDPLERRALLAAEFITGLVSEQSGDLAERTQFLDANGTIFLMAARGGDAGLWTIDGTVAGTKKLLAPPGVPEPPYDEPFRMAAVGDTLYFRNPRAGHQAELWKSDGTVAGTALVKRLPSRDLQSFTAVGRTLFFSCYDSTHGDELWKTDGTAAGTIMVKDIRPGEAGSAITSLVAVNGSLFFVADDGVHGAELWKSNGTEPGTKLVANIMWDDYGPQGSSPTSLTNVNGTLFFTATVYNTLTSLYRSDGTAAGTTALELLSGSGNGVPMPSEFAECRQTLLFAATGWISEYGDPSPGDVGRELWRSDGTPAGTRVLKDLAAGWDSSPGQFVDVAGTLFFTANWTDDRLELWTTDGTEAGTVIVRRLNNSGFQPLGAVNGKYFFIYDDGVHGREIWMSDGTAAGTVLAADVVPGPQSSIHLESSSLSTGSRLYFTADTGLDAVELWKLDAAAPSFATLSGQTLIVRGTDSGDTIGVTRRGPKIEASLNGRATAFPATLIRRVLIESGNGNDIVNADRLSIPLTVNAGTGNDRVTGGDSTDVLRGEGGKDTLLGGRGDDTLDGQSGHDYLVGGEGNDLLSGGSGDDRMEGNAGRDTLYGRAGNDALFGGSGNDRLDGGDGNDHLMGQAGLDRSYGGAGDDKFLARDLLADILDGGAGFDRAQIDPALDQAGSIERLLS